MADVLFGQSYFLRFDPKLWDAMQPYPPLGTLVAASVLRERGYDVALFDAMLADSEAEWAARVSDSRPRVAVLFEDNFNYLSKMCLLRMRQAAFAMSEAARAAGCTVIVCGSDASDHAEAYLDRGADFVLLGEGDETLVELMDRLSGRTEAPPEALRGLVFRDGQERTVNTGRRPVIHDLDRLPLPAWDLVDVDRYRRLWTGRHGYFSMNMVTTRGCPFHCNWCAKPIWGQTYHVRAPASVADEMAHLAETYAPDHIWFADDIMGLRRGWMASLADELEGRRLRIPFKSLSRADLLLREREVEAFARAGARTVWIGAESGSQKILDAMDKGTRVEQIYEAASRLRQAGIQVGFFLQFGYPGEEREDIEKTLRMVRDCAPDEIGVSVSYPLPGTKFHEMVEQELGAKRNWVDSSDLDMMHDGPFDTAFYRRLYAVVHKEFGARRGARELLGVLKSPRRFSRRHLRTAAAVCYHAGTLPIARLRLRHAARPSHRGFGLLSSGMTPQEAARPTEQEHDGRSR